MRNTVLCPDFFASVAALGARPLTLCNNIQCCLCSAGGLEGQIELLYSLQHSLPVHLSLPWLFILIQITSIFLYQHPIHIYNEHIQVTPSDSPLFPGSGDVQYPYCERILTYGGGRQHEFSALEVEPYITAGYGFNCECTFKFVDHVDSLGRLAYPITQNWIHANIPLPNILPYLSVRVALKIACLHHLQIGSHVPKSEICRIFEGHNCISCNLYSTVFAIVDSKAVRCRQREAGKLVDNSSASHVTDGNLPNTTLFPLPPVNPELSQKIINDFCADSSPSAMEEAGCAVCGQLVPVSQLTWLKAVKNFLHVLQVPGVTRIE
ncbi:hypothetical protein BYT27DRAFT_7110922 [Phlegmacium glaucopus]|nr:hypothetical protein BYT27DRAFT_7110922 [Phlegmacium glaucopus]